MNNRIKLFISQVMILIGGILIGLSWQWDNKGMSWLAYVAIPIGIGATIVYPNDK